MFVYCVYLLCIYKYTHIVFVYFVYTKNIYFLNIYIYLHIYFSAVKIIALTQVINFSSLTHKKYLTPLTQGWG